MSADSSRLPWPAVMAVTDCRRAFALPASGVTGAEPSVPRDASPVTFDLAARWAAAVAAAGVSLIYVREPWLDDRDLLDLTSRIVLATRDTACQVVVRARADIARAAGAHGVHLPAAGLGAAEIRRLLPRPAIVGRSVHSLEEALAADADAHCDYLLFGTVHPSASKPAGHVAAGEEGLASVCRNVLTPTYAIGGIAERHFAGLARAGAAGFAAIGLFVPALERESPSELTERVRGVVNACRQVFLSPPVPVPNDVRPDVAAAVVVNELPQEADPGAEDGADQVDGDPDEQTAAEEGSGVPAGDEGGDEAARALLSSLPVVERIKLASKGTREQRAQLVRDPNRMVTAAVLSSPKVSDAEIEAFAKMGNVSEDVLRTIGTNRTWLKQYGVVLALTRNPKTPPGIAMNLLRRLTERDIKAVVRDRNVSESVRLAARRLQSKGEP